DPGLAALPTDTSLVRGVLIDVDPDDDLVTLRVLDPLVPLRRPDNDGLTRPRQTVLLIEIDLEFQGIFRINVIFDVYPHALGSHFLFSFPTQSAYSLGHFSQPQLSKQLGPIPFSLLRSPRGRPQQRQRTGIPISTASVAARAAVSSGCSTSARITSISPLTTSLRGRNPPESTRPR